MDTQKKRKKIPNTHTQTHTQHHEQIQTRIQVIEIHPYNITMLLGRHTRAHTYGFNKIVWKLVRESIGGGGSSSSIEGHCFY